MHVCLKIYGRDVIIISSIHIGLQVFIINAKNNYNLIKASSFSQELGRRLPVTTGNPRESAFLFQRLSVALQRFNAVRIRDTFGAAQDNDSEKASLVVA